MLNLSLFFFNGNIIYGDNMNRSRSIVDITHLLIKDYLNKDINAVDMTLGNGNDTLFLAKHCKHVYAYEIQQFGIDNSIKLLKDNHISNYTIFHESHENVDKIANQYDVAIFNLGYLPKSDKTITTLEKSTINALSKLIDNESTKLIAIVVYRGHEEGYEESNAILNYINNLNQKFKITKIESINIKDTAPYLLLFEKNNWYKKKEE